MIAVEQSELAHELVEAPARGGGFAVLGGGEQARDAGPGEQGDMAKIATRGDGPHKALDSPAHMIASSGSAASLPLRRPYPTASRFSSSSRKPAALTRRHRDSRSCASASIA